MRITLKHAAAAAASAAWGALVFGAATAQTAPDAAPPEEAASVDASANFDVAVDLFARDTYAITPMVCPFKGAIDYDDEDTNCFRLAVPENRETETSRTIQLNVAKLAAREPDDWDAEEDGEWRRRDDPIIYLSGGPGAVAAGYVDRLKSHGVRDQRDLYILEQRGIGFSDDFCPEFSNVDPARQNASTFDESARANLAVLEACFERARAAGVDLSGYNTIENARDVKALRRALGFEQWNVWGISYGSILGQAYLHEDPDGIRAAVIDAIVPIDPAINFQGIARYYQRVLTILSDLCAEDKACAANFPDFEARLKQAIQTVEAEPIRVPDALDRELFPSGEASIFLDLIAGLPFIQFYEQDNYPTLPALIDALASIVEERDYDRFRLLTSAEATGGFVGISQGMYNAIACNDGWVATYRESFERDARDHPVLSLINGPIWAADENVALCEKYGMSPRDPADYAPRPIDTRTIIAEGAMDPITPPPFAEAILPNFTNGTYVEWPYAGHGPTRSMDCAGDFLTAFFDNPDGELDTSCADDMEKPDFAGPLYRSDAVLKTMAQLDDDPKGLIAPLALLGLAAIALPFAFLTYLAAPIARLINGERGAPTGGARLIALATAALGVASIAGLGYAAYATFEASELLIFTGLLGWARWAVIAGYAAGLAGLITLFLTVRTRLAGYLPIGTLIGLTLTGLSGAALAAGFVLTGFGVGG
ncbi:MAG: alpha/beta fold hydrolase [Pseudomonadota bacterium]